MRLPSLTNRSLQESTRTSPGIMSPADSLTISPGTRSRSGISFASPSRMTAAVTWIMALSFAAAASARASWMKRSATLSATIAAITVPARASPVPNEIADKAASRITSGLRMIFSRRIGQPCRRSCATSFGPAVRARSSASAWVRPAAVVCKDPRSSSPSFPAASRTAGETRMLWFFAGLEMADGSGRGPAGLEPSVPAGFTEATAALLASDVVIVPASSQAKHRHAWRTSAPSSRTSVAARASSHS